MHGSIALFSSFRVVASRIEIVNRKSNNLSGSIPSGLRWRQLFLLDLGFNELTGTLPLDLGETFGSLRRECPHPQCCLFSSFSMLGESAKTTATESSFQVSFLLMTSITGVANGMGNTG